MHASSATSRAGPVPAALPCADPSAARRCAPAPRWHWGGSRGEGRDRSVPPAARHGPLDGCLYRGAIARHFM